MNVNFVYSNLNPCGGGERLTLFTIEALLQIDANIDITTLEIPVVSKLCNAYGNEIGLILERINKINVIDIFNKLNIGKIYKNKYDLTINTHGDIDPFYHESFSCSNAITYCHFPSAKTFIDNEDKTFLENHLKVIPRNNNNESDSTTTSSSVAKKNDIKKYLNYLKNSYEKMMYDSTVVTNSQYSRNAIYDEFGINSDVINPPVDVDLIRNMVFDKNSSEKEDDILVISRIDPLKCIENALKVAKILHENGVGKSMKIIGSLDMYYYDYYKSLNKLIRQYDLMDYVVIETNANIDRLFHCMKKSKTYFHPRPGEHFGMAIVEAMSGGLVPVVPNIGGQTEFVDSKYRYDSIETAYDIIKKSFDVDNSERLKISDSVQKFSISHYQQKFKELIYRILPQLYENTITS